MTELDLLCCCFFTSNGVRIRFLCLILFILFMKDFLFLFFSPFFGFPLDDFFFFLKKLVHVLNFLGVTKLISSNFFEGTLILNRCYSIFYLC